MTDKLLTQRIKQILAESPGIERFRSNFNGRNDPNLSRRRVKNRRKSGSINDGRQPKCFGAYNRDIVVETVDTRLQNQEVSGQEILTKDKVALRISLIATWQFSDVLLAFAKLNKPAEHLYRELQFALREAIGERTLDTLLENKQSLNKLLLDAVQGKLANFGIDVSSVGLRDIILPGEMKTILAQVVEAQKAAEANVIKRREETNATRSLLNTAKVMEENATALRLKELETLERVAERIDKISVFGGLDQVLNGLISIKR